MTLTPFCFYIAYGETIGVEIAAFGYVIGDCCFYFVTVTYKLIYLKSISIDDFPGSIHVSVSVFLSSVTLLSHTREINFLQEPEFPSAVVNKNEHMVCRLLSHIFSLAQVTSCNLCSGDQILSLWL